MMSLLWDLAREKRGWSDLKIYDDGSSYDTSDQKQQASRIGAQWIDLCGGPHGRRGFWKVWTKILGELPRARPSRLFCFLSEDVRLCTSFFPRLLMAWNSRPLDHGGTPIGSAINVIAERARDTHPQWVGFTPVRINKALWQTQWVDGAFLGNGDLPDIVERMIPEPPERRWLNPSASSGVWEYVSRIAHRAGMIIYRVDRSLVVHVHGPSVMHTEHRAKEKLVTHKFIDGDEQCARLSASAGPEGRSEAQGVDPTCCERSGAATAADQRETIHASLASVPDRVHLLQKTIESLLPQVDLVRIYLNGYQDVPEFLRGERIVIARSQDHGDRGDAGKFFWCEEAGGYELHCDDDIVYRPDHVDKLIAAVERYGRKAVVSLHGCVVVPPVASYYKSRRLYHCNSSQPSDVPVHVLGTGSICYHCSTLRLCRADFKAPNMADIWFAIACEVQGVSRVVVAHEPGCVTICQPPTTIYDSCLGRDHIQTEAVKQQAWLPPAFPQPNTSPQADTAWPDPEFIDVGLDGVKAHLACDPGHTITLRMRGSHAFYEPDLLRAIRDLNVEGAYVDVGAHIGTHTVWFAKACRSTRVISFEPSPRYFRILSLNVASMAKCEAHKVAVGERAELVRLGGCSGRPIPDKLDVAESVSLDSFLPANERVAMLKVDVDGRDVAVLRGARALVERCRPYISVECFSELAMAELKQFMAQARYEFAGKYCATPTYILRPL
jgi:FkbM family methyltransferase